MYKVCMINAIAFDKPGMTSDLIDNEKSKIVKCHSEGCIPPEIVLKVLNGDHATFKQQFLENSHQGYIKHTHKDKKSCKFTPKTMRRIKCKANRNLLATSATIFYTW